jgi:hypothetical protein
LATTLHNERLEVLIDDPGAGYTGSRFDWTTQVRQITFDGKHRLLTREKEGVESPAAQGWGLAGEFGIEAPVGYEECPVGGAFPKIGVGLLTRPDDEAYRFHRPYTVRPARFGVKPEGPRGVLITASQDPERGWGWFLKRHWSVSGTVLSLTTTLANTGSKPLSTGEYIHNFFGYNLLDPVTDWSLTLPRVVTRPELAAWVDPETVMVLEGAQVTWTETPTQDFFISCTDAPPASWTLTHRPTGVRVSEAVDFPVAYCNVWGRGHVVSPELARKVEAAPGAVLTWTRTWTFG